MTIVKCDRCKKEAKTMSKYMIAWDKTNPVAKMLDKDIKIDLCNECADEFEAMIDAFLDKE